MVRLEELTRHTSPYLLCWIDLAMTPRRLVDVGQLRQVKRLAEKDFPVPYSEYTRAKLAPLQDFLKSRSGDWALLGELTNLQVLEFPKRMPPGLIKDFSFLPRLTKLYRLRLQYTKFTDCALLSGLTQLRELTLPARKKLIHTEVLDTLPCEVHTEEPFYRDDGFPAHQILQAQAVSPPPGRESGSLAARYLSYGGKCFVGGELTQEVLDRLAEGIRAGAVASLLLSLDENGEEDCFTMDVRDGWAAPTFLTTGEKGEEVCFQPVNEKFDSVEEDAPVEIGGQSPVPRRFALDDLTLAAECAVCFAQTGKLHPGIPWAAFS